MRYLAVLGIPGPRNKYLARGFAFTKIQCCYPAGAGCDVTERDSQVASTVQSTDYPVALHHSLIQFFPLLRHPWFVAAPR